MSSLITPQVVLAGEASKFSLETSPKDLEIPVPSADHTDTIAYLPQDSNLGEG